jgi:hypothetical protein
MQGPLNFRWMFWHDGWSHDLAPSVCNEKLALISFLSENENDRYNKPGVDFIAALDLIRQPARIFILNSKKVALPQGYYPVHKSFSCHKSQRIWRHITAVTDIMKPGLGLRFTAEPFQSVFISAKDF